MHVLAVVCVVVACERRRAFVMAHLHEPTERIVAFVGVSSIVERGQLRGVGQNFFDKSAANVVIRNLRGFIAANLFFIYGYIFSFWFIFKDRYFS